MATQCCYRSGCVLDSSRPDHQGCIGLVLEQSADPFDKVLNRRFDIKSDWQRLDVAAKVQQNFVQLLPGRIAVGIFPANGLVGGVEVRRFDPTVPLANLPQTPLTYRGREADAPCGRDAEQRIDSLRKAS